MQLVVLCAVCLLPGSLALPLPPEAGGMGEPQWEQAQVGHWPSHLGVPGLAISITKCAFQFG